MKDLMLSRFGAVVFVAVLAAAVLFVTLVTPKARGADNLRKDVRSLAEALEAARPGTPSRQDIDRWIRYGMDLRRDHPRVIDFYAACDRRFERWFPGLTLGSNRAPSRDAFVSRFRDEARKLQEDLRRASVTVGPVDDDGAAGFNWERLAIQELDVVGPADEAAVLHTVQKRFWARKRIADLALERNVRIGRIVDFRFFQRLHQRLRDETALGGGAEKVVWPGLGGELNPGLPRDQEIPLPGGLGTTFDFGAVLQLPLSETPRVIRELLDPGSDLLLTVAGAHITVGPQITRITVPCEQGKDEEEEFQRRVRELQKTNPPRPVLLTLTCRILDLDLAPAK